MTDQTTEFDEAYLEAVKAALTAAGITVHHTEGSLPDDCADLHLTPVGDDDPTILGWRPEEEGWHVIVHEDGEPDIRRMGLPLLVDPAELVRVLWMYAPDLPTAVAAAPYEAGDAPPASAFTRTEPTCGPDHDPIECGCELTAADAPPAEEPTAPDGDQRPDNPWREQPAVADALRGPWVAVLADRDGFVWPTFGEAAKRLLEDAEMLILVARDTAMPVDDEGGEGMRTHDGEYNAGDVAVEIDAFLVDPDDPSLGAEARYAQAQAMADGLNAQTGIGEAVAVAVADYIEQIDQRDATISTLRQDVDTQTKAALDNQAEITRLRAELDKVNAERMRLAAELADARLVRDNLATAVPDALEEVADRLRTDARSIRDANAPLPGDRKPCAEPLAHVTTLRDGCGRMWHRDGDRWRHAHDDRREKGLTYTELVDGFGPVIIPITPDGAR